MDDLILLKFRHIRELADNLGFKAATFSIDLFSQVPDAYSSSFWEFDLLAQHLQELYREAPEVDASLPAGNVILSFWQRTRACPDLIDPQLLWVAMTSHVPELVSQLETLIGEPTH